MTPEVVLRHIWDRRPTIDQILERKLPCFPVRLIWENGKFNKIPLVKGFTTKPPTTEAQIRKAFDKNPSFDVVGIPTGKISGFDTLDVDPRNGGDEWLQGAKLPPTRTQETLSGGLHFLFKHAEGVGSGSQRFAKGIDWRGDGGYVVDWSLSGFPTQYAGILTEWPPWLLDKVRGVTRLQNANTSLFDVSCNQPPPSDAEILAMLDVISSDMSYDEWWMIAAPIRRAMGDDGYEVWHTWCRKAGNRYNERAADKKWEEALKVHSFGFGTLFYLADKVDPSWRKAVDPKERTLAVNKDGKPAGGSENIRAAIAKLGVELRFNEFSGDITVSGLKGFGPLLDEVGISDLRFAIETEFKLLANKTLFYDVVIHVAHTNKFHPVRDYLDGLKWDRTERIDNWLTTYAGVEETPYTRAVGALWLTAAVRRIRQPGCKFDELPVIEGAQGIGKSEAAKILAVQEDWFFDGLCLASAGDGKKAIEDIRGRWIIESAEMSGMRRADLQRLKAFLSRQVDRARLAYDRMTTTQPRQCVFVGTTNDVEYLRDDTGNRRYWPVSAVKFNLEALKRDRDQLWAEASVHEAAGASIRMDQSLWVEAAEAQEERTVEDPWIEDLREALGHIKNGKITTAGALTLLDIPASQKADYMGQRVGKALAALGWRRPNEKRMVRIDGKVQRGFVIGDPPWKDIGPTKFGTDAQVASWKPSVIKGGKEDDSVDPLTPPVVPPEKPNK